MMYSEKYTLQCISDNVNYNVTQDTKVLYRILL